MTDKQKNEAVRAHRRQMLVNVMREAMLQGGPTLVRVLDVLRSSGARHSDLVELAGRAGYTAHEFDAVVYDAEQSEAAQ